MADTFENHLINREYSIKFNGITNEGISLILVIRLLLGLKKFIEAI